MKFVNDNWNNFDNHGFCPSEIENFLKFVCFNNEVYYNNKTYLQIRGCPMGSHFAPAFAVIYMNHVETIALNKLHLNHNIQPCLYKRYIDDIILGPFPNDPRTFNTIEETFNSVCDEIKFAIEVPTNNVLNFLDISVSISNHVKYEMHIKDCHSGNSLHADSWVPSHVKSNFIHNSFNYVNKRCSTAETMSVNYEKMHQKLATNGYRKNSMHVNKTTLKSKSIYTSDSKRVVLKLDYIN